MFFDVLNELQGQTIEAGVHRDLAEGGSAEWPRRRRRRQQDVV